MNESITWAVLGLLAGAAVSWGYPGRVSVRRLPKLLRRPLRYPHSCRSNCRLSSFKERASRIPELEGLLAANVQALNATNERKATLEFEDQRLPATFCRRSGFTACNSNLSEVEAARCQSHSDRSIQELGEQSSGSRSAVAGSKAAIAPTIRFNRDLIGRQRTAAIQSASRACGDKRSLIMRSKLIDPDSPTPCFLAQNSTVDILSCNVRPGARRNGGTDLPALLIVTISASQALHMLNVGCLGD